MLTAIPLLVIPFILFNIGLAAAPTEGGNFWQGSLFSVPMMSGGVWSMTMADALVVIALVLLFIEIMKSTRTSNRSIIDHVLSLFVFVAFLVEFLLVGAAASSVFFILMIMALFDVVAGFTVSITSAGRDVTMA